MINMSAIVNDSDLGSETLTRSVRTETVNNFGESELSAVTGVFNAIVTSPSQQELIRLDAGTITRDTIKVITTTKLNDGRQGGQADMITRNGTNYIVRIYNDYTSYGFNYAICEMTDLVGQG